MIAAAQDRRQRLDVEIAGLQQRIEALIARNPTHAPNQKLLKHLPASVSTCSRSSRTQASQPRTGARSRRSARQS